MNAQINVKDAMFGAIGDGVTDDTAAIQSAIRHAGSRGCILFPPGVYRVNKSRDSDVIERFKFNDQPCIYMEGTSGVDLVGYGAKLRIDVHAQGVLELQQCENVTIRGLTFEGPGQQPECDARTGLAEKGNIEGGYDTTGQGIWNDFKNNSKDTRKYTGGVFSQYDKYPPSTDSPDGSNWGSFGGGFIGNHAYGVLVQNGCHQVTVVDCEAHGFNGAGFCVGFRGDSIRNGFPPSSSIVIRGCRASSNYNANFAAYHVDGMIIDGCISTKSGHLKSNETHLFWDPGYGVHLTGAKNTYPENVVVTNCILLDNVRKGIDVHAGKKLIISNNIVRRSNNRGIYAGPSGGEQPCSEVIVVGNIVSDCCRQPSEGSAVGLGGFRSPEAAKMRNAVISSNVIANCNEDTYTMRIRHGVNINVTGNVVTGGATPDSTVQFIVGCSHGGNGIAFANNLIRRKHNVLAAGGPTPTDPPCENWGQSDNLVISD